jgi:hypothetical protein
MGNPLMSQQFYETDPARGFVRGYSLVGERTFGLFSQSLVRMGNGSSPFI